MTLAEIKLKRSVKLLFIKMAVIAIRGILYSNCVLPVEPISLENSFCAAFSPNGCLFMLHYDSKIGSLVPPITEGPRKKTSLKTKVKLLFTITFGTRRDGEGVGPGKFLLSGFIVRRQSCWKREAQSKQKHLLTLTSWHMEEDRTIERIVRNSHCGKSWARNVFISSFLSQRHALYFGQHTSSRLHAKRIW